MKSPRERNVKNFLHSILGDNFVLLRSQVSTSVDRESTTAVARQTASTRKAHITTPVRQDLLVMVILLISADFQEDFPGN